MPHVHTAPDQVDLVVAAYLVFRPPDGVPRVLLLHSARSAHWLAPGGHVELTESADEALLREVEEETGLDLDGGEYEIVAEEGPASGHDFFQWRPRHVECRPPFHAAGAPPGHRHLALVYYGRAHTDRVTLDPREHDAFQWITAAHAALAAADGVLWPNVAFYVCQAIEESQAWQ
jgi:8-oxo-dGTP pyrophosphatase MutT (NUDIX family)